MSAGTGGREPAPEPGHGATGPSTTDAARQEAAAQIRRDHPDWVVIWSALSGEFPARPLFPAPRDTVATGTTPGQLTARMNAIRRAAPRTQRSARG
jgi:hypothetical protein